jgi:hypothetical protein
MNHAVLYLKRRATTRPASDEKSLSAPPALDYGSVFVINVNSVTTHIDQTPQQIGGQLFSLAVQLENGVPHIVEQQA